MPHTPRHGRAPLHQGVRPPRRGTRRGRHHQGKAALEQPRSRRLADRAQTDEQDGLPRLGRVAAVAVVAIVVMFAEGVVRPRRPCSTAAADAVAAAVVLVAVVLGVRGSR